MNVFNSGTDEIYLYKLFRSSSFIGVSIKTHVATNSRSYIVRYSNEQLWVNGDARHWKLRLVILSVHLDNKMTLHSLFLFCSLDIFRKIYVLYGYFKATNKCIIYMDRSQANLMMKPVTDLRHHYLVSV